jgi:hypothetical protein
MNENWNGKSKEIKSLQKGRKKKEAPREASFLP